LRARWASRASGAGASGRGFWPLASRPWPPIAPGRTGPSGSRHGHQEWLRFLKQIAAQTPADQELHLIVDNYATHKHPKVIAWLAKHPRIHLHFTPTSASWLNMMERFFRGLSTRRRRHGIFQSVAQLEAAITDSIAIHNAAPKHFIWAAKAADILAKVSRAKAALEKLQN
jgi:transposase